MSKRTLHVGLIGVGLVGKALIGQLERSAAGRIVIVGLAGSSRMRLSSGTAPLGLAAVAGLADGSGESAQTDLAALVQHVSKVSRDQGGIPVVVDCTASGDLGKLYPTWLESGVSIVTPNKKAFSSDLALFKKIRELRDKAYCYHEATVGAGLPILSTLEDFIETGDEIVKIEGIFSGTLSFLFNAFSSTSSPSSRKFSEIVKEAKALGYTEPDPRDDLNGMDMARKVVILGRLAKLDISLETLPVENIVPEPLRTVASGDEFLSRLGEFDDHFAKLNAEAAANQEVLRYVGVIDPSGKSSVQLKRYPASHPFASLKGSDNIIAFTTKRYPNPLVIQGAGAGAEVTAAGVFGDLLKILRARL